MKRMRIRAVAAGAAVALAASLVAACGSDSTAGDNGAEQSTPGTSEEQPSEQPSDTGSAEEQPSESETGDTGTTEEQPSEGGESEAGDAGAVDFSNDTKKTITIPIAAGWSEDVAVSHLWKHLLEQEGFTVKLTTLDVGPIFDGIANDQYDVFFDTWLPNTHKKYWKQYGDKVDDINVWYDEAPLTIAVPDYMDIDSMDQLKDIGDKVNKTITGIDAGAGLTDVTKNSMMPAYGLDKAGWNLQISSTAAMLAALKKATDNHDPIVVTLWKPHWAYSVFPIKDLKDPKNAMGDPDEIHVIGSPKLADQDPGLIQALKKFHMDDATLADLESVTVQDPDMSAQEITDAAAKWASENQDFIDSFMK